jgi:hypothetical protein
MNSWVGGSVDVSKGIEGNITRLEGLRVVLLRNQIFWDNRHLLWLLDPEDDVTTTLQNVGNYLTFDKRQDHRKFESSSEKYKLCVCRLARTARSSSRAVSVLENYSPIFIKLSTRSLSSHQRLKIISAGQLCYFASETFRIVALSV